jgi:hypothetical protein
MGKQNVMYTPHLAFQKKKVMIRAASQMNLENTMLSDFSQSEKTLYDRSHVVRLSLSQKVEW